MSQQAMIECRHVTFTYPQQTEPAIEDISFGVYPGEFVVLCGQSGCGKTTLLRHLKKNQIPFGKGSGQLLYRGDNLEEMDDRTSAMEIGYVGQNPENQIVTDKVWHELAFGLENLGVPVADIRKRTAETAEYFGMGTWYRKDVSQLSGGQKQILNLAAVMVMQPEVLILDEPTSQLDPIGARRFLATLAQLNQDFGTTILLSEQRLEDIIPLSDRVLVMHQGHMVGYESPEGCGRLLGQMKTQLGRELPIAHAMPVAMRVFAERIGDGEILPVTIRQGKQRLTELYQRMCKASNVTNADKGGPVTNTNTDGVVALEAQKLSYGYQKGQQILDGMELQVRQGTIYALLGGNGSGKTTAMKVLAGIYRSWRGKVRHQGKMLYLAQNPLSLFTEVTVEEELAEVLEGKKADQVRAEVDGMLRYLELEQQRMQNPMDLSGGQQQRLALGKLLLLQPDILLLDEPTKGQDSAFKEKLALLLRKLAGEGKTIVLVSHDLEFCAEYATECGLLFDGQIISSGPVREFFADNHFYTTAASRMAAGILPDCILCQDIVDVLTAGGEGSSI